MTMELLFFLIAVGALSGLLAGLLGVGGGLVVVPALLHLLPLFGIPAAAVMHMALATSLACIVFTSGSSAYTHFRYGNVQLSILKFLVPGLIIGGLVGSQVAAWVPADLLPKIFALILCVLAVMMIKKTSIKKSQKSPSLLSIFLNSIVIAVVSTLAGIGGGSMTVPYLSKQGLKMRYAVGCSSVASSVIGLSGIIGFFLTSTAQATMPEYSFGYIYLPAFVLICCTSMLTSRIGVKLVMVSSPELLKKIFSLFLLFVAASILFKG